MPDILERLELCADESERGHNFAATPPTVRLAIELIRQLRARVESLLEAMNREVERRRALHRRLRLLEEAGLNLYHAGKWELTRGDVRGPAQTRLWEDFRDALGLAPGTATAAGVGMCQPHGCPKCDDAMECSCEPPLPFGGGPRLSLVS